MYNSNKKHSLHFLFWRKVCNESRKTLVHHELEWWGGGEFVHTVKSPNKILLKHEITFCWKKWLIKAKCKVYYRATKADQLRQNSCFVVILMGLIRGCQINILEQTACTGLVHCLLWHEAKWQLLPPQRILVRIIDSTDDSERASFRVPQRHSSLIDSSLGHI